MSHSTATDERSFSVLKRVKTYLLSTMPNGTGKTHPWHCYRHIHRHIQLPLDAVVDKFDKTQTHVFGLWHV